MGNGSGEVEVEVEFCASHPDTDDGAFMHNPKTRLYATQPEWGEQKSPKRSPNLIRRVRNDGWLLKNSAVFAGGEFSSAVRRK